MYLNNTIIPPVKSRTTAKKIHEPACKLKINPTSMLTRTNHTIISLGLEENKNRLVVILKAIVTVNIRIFW